MSLPVGLLKVNEGEVVKVTFIIKIYNDYICTLNNLLMVPPKFYFLFILFFNFGNIHAQNFEELEETLKNKTFSDIKRLEAGEMICKGKRYAIIKPQVAIPIIDYMFKIANESDNRIYLGRCYHYYGMAYYRMGLIDLSIASYEKSLLINEKIGEIAQLSGSLNNIAIIYRNFNELEKSLNYAFRSLEIKKELKLDDIVYPYNTIGNAYLVQENYSLAMEYFDTCYHLSKEVGNMSQTVNSLINKGRIQKRLKNYSNAKLYLKEAIKICENINSEFDLSHTYDAYSSILIEAKEYKKALIISNKNLELAKKSDSYAFKFKAYKRLYEIHKYLKKYKEALTYHEKFWEHKGLFLSDNNRKSMLKAEYKINFDLKHLSDSLINQNQIKLLIEERKVQTAKKETLWVILFFVCFTTFCTIFFIKYRSIQKQQVLKVEIEGNRIELDSFTTQLREHNKVQLILKNKLEEVIKKTNYTENNFNLSELVNSKILTDDDWIVFKIKFNKVYPLFCVQIRDKIKKLTLEEERLIIMNKLNLKNSEIAQIVGISSESIRKSRYRLKKRLKISKEISLVQYIEN